MKRLLPTFGVGMIDLYVRIRADFVRDTFLVRTLKYFIGNTHTRRALESRNWPVRASETDEELSRGALSVLSVRSV